MGMMDFIQTAAQNMGGQAPINVAEGYTDPLDNMNFLEKLGLGLGGIDAVNSARRSGMLLQDRQREEKQRTALQELAGRMQRGEINQQQGNMEYAGITGNYSNLFGGSTPSAIQEHKYYQSLSDDEKRSYLQTRRGNQKVDRGDTVLVIDGQGNVIGQHDKQLAPNELPETKADQTTAVENAKAKTAEMADMTKKAGQAKDVISLTEQALQYLEDASGSYLDVAQNLGKRVIGRSDAETQANAALKVISGKLVSHQPRMEGPQSDKDVQLYKDMAANIADTSLPASDKRVAIQALIDLNAKYAEFNTTTEGENGTNINWNNVKASNSGRKTVNFGDLK